MKILLTNDDGIQSPGLRLLAAALGKEHQVTVVAPDGQRSAVSHGLTMREDLHAEPDESFPGMTAWAVRGTPADCTRLALDVLCPQAELIISGPNVGMNVAFDTLYSGTVAAALEGAMHGIKAIAVSAHHLKEDVQETVEIFMKLFAQLDVERDIRHLLNVNIPALPGKELKGFRWAPQGLYHQWEDHYWAGKLETQRNTYKLHGTEKPALSKPEDDSSAVMHGYVALTPLTFDLTDRAWLAEVQKKEYEL